MIAALLTSYGSLPDLATTALAELVRTIAADIDPFCEAVTTLNLQANGVKAEFLDVDCIDTDDGWDVVLAGDVFYDEPLADRLMPSFGLEVSAYGAAAAIADVTAAWVVDEADAGMAERIGAELGLEVGVTDTIMTDDGVAESVARSALQLLGI